jgi:hypothetical protein
MFLCLSWYLKSKMGAEVSLFFPDKVSPALGLGGKD